MTQPDDKVESSTVSHYEWLKVNYASAVGLLSDVGKEAEETAKHLELALRRLDAFCTSLGDEEIRSIWRACTSSPFPAHPTVSVAMLRYAQAVHVHLMKKATEVK